ncbi:hypothetical protein NDU88_006486 [Pleurodeles waltl]|uniref:Uncharacterized protein n=1 Tax=Pleurodeles waltl TaxID=8319 RepID=A0AAV7NQW0_PLEWA|nr:hypothetical protein NDU88_006486 [Pleurodeles waltl]
MFFRVARRLLIDSDSARSRLLRERWPECILESLACVFQGARSQIKGGSDYNSLACADTATLHLEANGETGALVGRLPLPRELTWIKRGIPPFPGEEVVSGSWNTPELVKSEDWTDREDAEQGVTETAVRTSVTTGQSGAEESQRITEDRWPWGAYA